MGIKLIKIAVVYFLFGIFMGMFMSITKQFQYAPSHAHINLLGWASLALSGIIYHIFPSAGNSKLGKVHFWLHNIGLPIMMLGLIFLEGGNLAMEPMIIVGANLTTLGIILFVLNVFINIKPSAQNMASERDISEINRNL